MTKPNFVRGLLFCLALIAFSCKNQESNVPAPSNERLEYYGTGKLQRRSSIVNGKKEGKMTDYYPGGSVKAERWFKNDQQVDMSVLYYEGGAVQEVQYYQDGKKEGGDTVFYEKGSPQFVMAYHGGLKHGYLRKWSETAELIYEARYEMDSLVEVKGKKVK